MEGLDDEILWRFDASGSFSVKSFSLQVFRSAAPLLPIFDHAKVVWRGLAPPRVELLVWFILLERLNTKDRLRKFKCIPEENSLCTLCLEDNESISHLFFSCPVAWRLWFNCMQWWNISFCYPSKPVDFFSAWIGAPFKGFDKTLWISMMYVVLWSIWKIRNRIIFDDVSPNWEIEIQQLKIRLGYWVKDWCSEFPFSPNFVADNLQAVRSWHCPLRIRNERS